MEKQLKQILSSNMNIYNAVGSSISPLKRDNFPSITYQRTGKEQDTDIKGNPIGPCRSAFNISIRDTSYATAKDISLLVEKELDGKSGLFGDTRILLSIQDDQSEDQLYDPDVVEITLTYTFHHIAA